MSNESVLLRCSGNEFVEHLSVRKMFYIHKCSDMMYSFVYTKESLSKTVTG